MAEVQQQDSGSDKGKHKKVRAKKASTHIDMTPMVDLAFLLLTFFILTTTLSKPRTMDITMPVKDDIEDADRTKVPASQTLSILLTENDKIIWYIGVDNPEEPPVTAIADFSATSSNSIHKLLLEKNKMVLDQVKLVDDSVRLGLIPNKVDEIKKHKAAVKAAEKKGLIVLIKPDEKSKYRNLVDILDEMLVTNVARYAIVDLSDSEKELILNAK
ncbi:MAG: biopolymer transporter ExbD [Bacteroidia bacterium]|nr:biopolymer transporter ExbD [Bacteroidia bacterium]